MNINADTINNIILKAKVTFDTSSLKSNLTFKEMGVDSLDQFNIFLAVEEALDVKIPDEDIEGINSIDDFVSYLNKQ